VGWCTGLVGGVGGWYGTTWYDMAWHSIYGGYLPIVSGSDIIIPFPVPTHSLLQDNSRAVTLHKPGLPTPTIQIKQAISIRVLSNSQRIHLERCWGLQCYLGNSD